jgi:hypothetical protein
METLQQKNEIKSYNLRLEVRFLWGCLTTTEMVLTEYMFPAGMEKYDYKYKRYL